MKFTILLCACLQLATLTHGNLIKRDVGGTPRGYFYRQPQQKYYEAASAQQQEPAIEQQQEPAVEQQQEPAIEQQQEPAIEQQQEPAMEQQQEPAIEQQQEPAMEQQQEPAVEQQQEPAIEQQQEPAVEQQQEPAVEQQQEPAIEQQQEPEQQPEEYSAPAEEPAYQEPQYEAPVAEPELPQYEAPEPAAAPVTEISVDKIAELIYNTRDQSLDSTFHHEELGSKVHSSAGHGSRLILRANRPHRVKQPVIPCDGRKDLQTIYLERLHKRPYGRRLIPYTETAAGEEYFEPSEEELQLLGDFARVALETQD